ncbi:MAG: radical SAM protein [Clostridiaceae bacterium]|nr:radical SAM protein [Clostridiaceae bacterium]
MKTMSNQNIPYLGVMADMAGCPNRCRHCWLGARKNGHMSVGDFKDIAAQFKSWRGSGGSGIVEMSFFSWWREPDFRDDYRELWRLEQELSSPGQAKRFELLSTWRLARDETYAKWAAMLPPKACQITFFGMEENTDWGMRRKGAFRDQLTATERCFAVGITPRWQLFLTKRCLDDLDEYLRLIREYQVPQFFIGGMSPEGGGYELEEERIERSDIARIPPELTALSRDGLNMLGVPEDTLLHTLLHVGNPPRMSANFPCLAVDADFDVYPNIAEPAPWWKLGNLKTGSVDTVMKMFIDEETPGMTANRGVPVSELAKTYGIPGSQKLYAEDDLICRLMHQWGVDYMKGSM